MEPLEWMSSVMRLLLLPNIAVGLLFIVASLVLTYVRDYMRFERV